MYVAVRCVLRVRLETRRRAMYVSKIVDLRSQNVSYGVILLPHRMLLHLRHSSLVQRRYKHTGQRESVTDRDPRRSELRGHPVHPLSPPHTAQHIRSRALPPSVSPTAPRIRTALQRPMHYSYCYGYLQSIHRTVDRMHRLNTIATTPTHATLLRFEPVVDRD